MMSEREQIEQEAEARGWTRRRGGSWTSFARNDVRVAIDWSDSWQATAAEMSMAGSSGLARSSWRSSTVTPADWALTVLRRPLIARTGVQSLDAAEATAIEQTQAFCFAVAQALIATAVELRRLALMIDRAAPRARAQLHGTIRTYATQLDSEISHAYLDTSTANAVAGLRHLVEETRR
jgi:hypothetical protein